MEAMMEAFKAALMAEYSLGQWMLVFYIYSFAGWCWEVGIYLVKERRFVNRGFLFGPILPIYGFGALSILLTCVPVQDHIALVALVGMTAATVLEFVTGVVMEALFHVRYWDYTGHVLSVKGHICLMSAATWAFFSTVIVCVIHPLLKPYVQQIPAQLALAASGTLTIFAVIDVVLAVRRALDLRVLLESMERYAKELETLHGGLDSISERVGNMVRAFAERVDAKQEELSVGVERVTAARDRVKQMMSDKRISLEEGARERFANFERILAEAASFLPDTRSLHAEVEAEREKYDRQTAALHQTRQSRLNRAIRVLRANPTAMSERHKLTLAQLRQEQEEDARARRQKRQKRREGRREKRRNKKSA